ncbi:delta-aminolevulinic acid dehydratase [Sporosarcina newyorkensis 2681]|uniref:Delta-aminolevulinic acid dehydratase n=1 Tax=Sporosarcina newyorkensis 2681 TaxID=1027292 RepID=F9DXG0_9BACL|nr:delta-aminolevulinic acid dehydratase [Sporosarcina newyorkensis 2681]
MVVIESLNHLDKNADPLLRSWRFLLLLSATVAITAFVVLMKSEVAGPFKDVPNSNPYFRIIHKIDNSDRVRIRIFYLRCM